MTGVSIIMVKSFQVEGTLASVKRQARLTREKP